jgi:hypothetical protein
MTISKRQYISISLMELMILMVGIGYRSGRPSGGTKMAPWSPNENPPFLRILAVLYLYPLLKNKRRTLYLIEN